MNNVWRMFVIPIYLTPFLLLYHLEKYTVWHNHCFCVSLSTPSKYPHEFESSEVSRVAKRVRIYMLVQFLFLALVQVTELRGWNEHIKKLARIATGETSDDSNSCGYNLVHLTTARGEYQPPSPFKRFQTPAYTDRATRAALFILKVLFRTGNLLNVLASKFNISIRY